MANELEVKKVATGIEISISKSYRVLGAAFTITTFWYHVKRAIDLARVNKSIQVPGDDVETFVAVMRTYFESNRVYELLDDETKEVILVVHSHTTRYTLDKIMRESGDFTLRPFAPWSLTIKDL